MSEEARERWEQNPPNARKMTFSGVVVDFGSNKYSGLVHFDWREDSTIEAVKKGMFRLASTKNLSEIAEKPEFEIGRRVSGEAFVISGIEKAEIIKLRLKEGVIAPRYYSFVKRFLGSLLRRPT